MKEILVTDTLFIHDEHVAKLEEAGYKVVRLDTPNATAEELKVALEGKEGYIMGGVELVTEEALSGATSLKAIAFTGADWGRVIPAHEKVTEMGIAITNTPGANKHTVAEFTVTAILAMTRNLFDVTRTGSTTFLTTESLQDLTVGIIGMGRIGQVVTNMLHGLGVKEVIYYSREEKKDVDARFVSLDELLKTADVVSMHASSAIGTGYIGERELALMKDGALVVDCGFIDGIDQDALYEELKRGRLRGFQDYPADERFKDLPYSTWMHSNAHTAFNTHAANRLASDMAVESMLNIFATGDDQYKVN